jgi:thiol-disulfide isomerase/thioredoxin
MKTSIDRLLPVLQRNEKVFNEVTDYLFDLLERHSLFQASEYLAIKVLNEVSCTVNSDLAKQLETYRAMKKGNTAPDIRFASEIRAPGFNPVPEKLSDLKATYTVVVFGASWCETCKKEVPEIASLYGKWKANGVEVVLVSLDESKDAFQSFVKDFPFISTCDFKKWEGQMVQDYYVFGTPTMFLLDASRKILLRPTSVKQMDAWVDWYLVKGNPMPR